MVWPLLPWPAVWPTRPAAPLALIPVEAIGRPVDVLEMNLVLTGSAARAAGNNHVIPGVKRVFRHAIVHQPPGAAPFREPGLDLLLPIGNVSK